MAAFNVYLDVLLSMRYRVEDAATPDEAEQIAEKWAEEGVRGAILEHEVIPGGAELADDEEENVEDSWGDF